MANAAAPLTTAQQLALWLNSGLGSSGPLQNLTAAYALALALLALYWWGQVWREARQGQELRVGWWNVPGWLALLLSPLLDVPALFGVGAAALLLAEYWPGSYRPVRRRTRPRLIPWLWIGPALVLGIALLAFGETSLLALVCGTGLIMTAGAGLAGLAGQRQQARASRPSSVPRQGFEVRWSKVEIPAWPELSVTLTQNGAQLSNVSGKPLTLAGWSPASLNSWLLVRDELGRPLNTLAAGQTAFLPLHRQESGVRVWYTDPQNSARLFRADWTPVNPYAQRVLN